MEKSAEKSLYHQVNLLSLLAFATLRLVHYPRKKGIGTAIKRDEEAQKKIDQLRVWI